MPHPNSLVVLAAGALCSALFAAPANAGRASLLAQIKGGGPSANASEIPALATLLEKTGWTPTPELSGIFKTGSIFRDTGSGHSLMIRDCFDAAEVRDSYTSLELVTQLQAGVRVRAGLVSARGSGELVKKVKFSTPVHHSLERLAMTPSPACREKLSKVSKADLAQMYAVQDVLMAKIWEQTCGRIDAKGRFVGLGGGELELSRACHRLSLEPVAVAYRPVPLSKLGLEGSDDQVRPLVQRVEPAPDCPWGTIKSVSTTMSTITVNGTTEDARGLDNRAKIMDAMQRCGRPEAAKAFGQWREWRRTTNIASATIVGFYPFGIGMVAASQAGRWRPYMEQILMDPSQALTLEGKMMPGPKRVKRMRAKLVD